MLISLNQGHRPTVEYQRLLRDRLNADVSRRDLFYFQTADIVSQVLNFGLSAPIDIQIQDPNFTRAMRSAQRHPRAIQKVPGVVDSAHHPDHGFSDARRSMSTANALRGSASRSAMSPTTC